jgi:signal peptidase I
MAKKFSADKKRSPVNIIEGIVITVLIVLIIFMLVVYFAFSKTGATPKFFGYTFYRTMAVNMETDIPAGTAIIAKASEIDNIKEGSVVLCKVDETTVLTRVVQIVNENGQLSYVVKFDTAPAADTFKIPGDNVIAKAIYQSAGLGSMLGFVTSTFGIMLIIIIPSFIIIVFQVIRIINVKRKEEDASSLDDLDEIMKDSDNRFEDMFSDDIPADEEPKLRPIAKKADEAAGVLTVDDSGKAAEIDKDGPIFTFEKPEAEKKKEKPKHVIPKPKTPNTDSFYSYLSDKADDQLYGGRIKRQEIVEDEEEQANDRKSAGFFTIGHELHKDKKPETASENISKEAPAAVEAAPTAPVQGAVSHNEAQHTVIPEVKQPVREAVKEVKAPQPAAPQKRRNTDQAISELMGMINAEEKKLHK